MKRAVTARCVGRSIEFGGAIGAISLAVQRAGARSMWSPRERGYLLVPVEDASDVMVDLEYRQRRTVVFLHEPLPWAEVSA